jgi:hypothetical protein
LTWIVIASCAIGAYGRHADACRCEAQGAKPLSGAPLRQTVFVDRQTAGVRKAFM